LGDDLVEDVGLRLANSAGRQPRRTSLEARKIGQSLRLTAGIMEVIGGIGYSKSLSIGHDAFLSLRGKLKGLESG
jgi:hypothetical protein